MQMQLYCAVVCFNLFQFVNQANDSFQVELNFARIWNIWNDLRIVFAILRHETNFFNQRLNSHQLITFLLANPLYNVTLCSATRLWFDHRQVVIVLLISQLCSPFCVRSDDFFQDQYFSSLCLTWPLPWVAVLISSTLRIGNTATRRIADMATKMINLIQHWNESLASHFSNYYTVVARQLIISFFWRRLSIIRWESNSTFRHRDYYPITTVIFWW